MSAHRGAFVLAVRFATRFWIRVYSPGSVGPVTDLPIRTRVTMTASPARKACVAMASVSYAAAAMALCWVRSPATAKTLARLPIAPSSDTSRVRR